MQLSFEWYVQELTHWPLVRAMMPGLKTKALVAVEVLTLVACTAGYYLQDHSAWSVVALCALGPLYFGLNYFVTGRWVRASLARQGRVALRGMSHLDLIEELRVEHLLKKAEESGHAARVVEIEHASTAAQAELEARSVVGPPAWLGKVAAWVGPMALSLIVALGDTPKEKLYIFMMAVLPLFGIAAVVSMMVPWLSSRRTNMLGYVRVLVKAKRQLDLHSVAHGPQVAGAADGHDAAPLRGKVAQLK